MGSRVAGGSVVESFMADDTKVPSGKVEALKRADGTPYYRARITLADDSRVRVDVPAKYSTPAGGKTARERAELYAAAAQEREDDTGELLTKKRAKGAVVMMSQAETCAQYFTRWNEARRVRTPRQAKADESVFRLWLDDRIGATPIATVTRQQLIDLSHALDVLAAKGEAFGEKRARNIFSVASAMFRDAYTSKDSSLRVLAANPMCDVPWPERGGRSALKQMLFPAELLALASCPETPLVRARLYVVTLYTATRAAEARILATSHVDLEHGSVRILGADDPTARKATGKASVKSTKGGKSRLVTLEATLAPLLAAMVAEAGAGARLFPDRPAGTPKGNQWRKATEDYIPGPDGEYGLCGTFKRDLRRALAWARIAERPELFDESDRKASLSIRFHDLRASGITWRHARRDNPAAILQECGHEDQATNEIYIRALRGLAPADLFPVLPARLLGEPGPSLAKFAGRPQKHRQIVGAEGFEPPTSTV